MTAFANYVGKRYMKPEGDLDPELEEFRAIWEALGQLSQEQPSADLRARFYRRLNSAPAPNPFLFWRKWPSLQFAGALALFIGGIYFGRLTTPAHEVAQLKTEVQGLHETVALSLLQRQSATSRLEGISWGSRVERPDGELLSALVATLNRDPNTNVRLASLDALEKFSGDPSVRKALVDSIAVQDSPLVQIALIDSLVHVHDNAAAGPFRKLTGDGRVNVAVRQRAQWGLEKLTYQ